mgnify:CR=1 FL=1
MITVQISLFAFYAARAILYLLFVVSFFTVAFFIDRLLFFRRFLASDHERILTAAARVGSLDEMRTILAANSCEETRIVLEALEESPHSASVLRELVNARLIGARQRWERFTDFLGTVGSNAPFVGLLGTVLGIMKSFADLAHTTKGGPQAVMSGISEALIATAVGLAVAIPAIIFFNVCKVRIRRSGFLVEALTGRTVAIMDGTPGKDKIYSSKINEL